MNYSVRITAEAIEDAMSIAPQEELTIFKNRDKFDLIVMYDDSSTNPGHGTAMEALVSAIWEQEFKKATRSVPVVLIGGLDAWVREGGAVTSSKWQSTPSSSQPATPGPSIRNIDSSQTTDAALRSYSNGRTRAGTESASQPRPLTLGENQARMRQSLDQTTARCVYPAQVCGGLC
jgi:hypothetical protein